MGNTLMEQRWCFNHGTYLGCSNVPFNKIVLIFINKYVWDVHCEIACSAL